MARAPASRVPSAALGRTILWGLVAASALPARVQAVEGIEAGPVTVGIDPSPNERKAVRGSWAPEEVRAWEVRELEAFERVAFNRAAMAKLRATRADEDGVLPPGFAGSWQGSGDEEAATLADPDLETRWDPEVVKYVEHLTRDAKGRSVMASLLRRRTRYDPGIQDILQREGVPRDLIYMGLVETALEPTAQWSDDTAGPWRLSPEAARTHGLEVGFWVDGRRDPELAAAAAARRLKDLRERFGSWSLALAAHRMGPENMLALVDRLGTNDYVELRDRRDGLPREALAFVARVQGAAIVGRNAAGFGFKEVLRDPPSIYEKVAARPGTTLTTLARAASVGIEALKALNPELVRDRTPPDRPSYQLRVPPGAARVLSRGVADQLTTADEVITYFLRPGESLDDVASKYGIPARELRRLNGIKDASEVRGGVTVLLPTRAEPGAAPRGRANEESPMLVAVPRREFSYPDRERVFYRICDGDTLEDLARIFRVDAAEIVGWNNLDRLARLQAGMVLQLFVSPDLDRSSLALLDPGGLRVIPIGSDEFHEIEVALRGKTRLTYSARAGDTLTKIARRYGLAAPDLARVNRMSWNAELAEGQSIVIYSPRGIPREMAVGRTSLPRRPGNVAAPKAAAAASRSTGGRGAQPQVTLMPVDRGQRSMSPKAAGAARPGVAKAVPSRRAAPTRPGAR
jgi:membrane-bound lytic murein transglycosylase D